MTDFTIMRLGHHGDGIADGPIYAPLTLPGEVVTGRLDGQVLREVKIVQPSPARVAAPCPHFRGCGGCLVQHGSDAFVAEWKTGLVTHALKAHGLETDMRPIKTSPPQSRRRATIAARRTKKAAMAGFHGRGSDVIIEVPDCKLLDPRLMPGMEIARLLAEIGTSRKAALAVTITASMAGLDVAVAGGKPLDGQLRMALAQIGQDPLVARLTWEDEAILTRSAPVQQFGRALVTPPPGAFLQATRQGEADLLAAVTEAVDGAAHLADLFAGCGTFSLPLTETADVLAVESVAEMLKAMETGWRGAQGLKPLKTLRRDLFRRPLLPDELKQFEAVVLDPPRAGAEAQVAELAQSDVPRIAYVSCNPVTFARDAATLVSTGFSLDWVQVVDQFRWSAHVELAAQFSRAHMA